MRLNDLKPYFETGPDGQVYLVCYCPKCDRHEGPGVEPFPDCGGMCLPIHVAGQEKKGVLSWLWNGERDFDKLTLSPSIWHHCKSDPHFFIREGEIVFA